MGLYKRRLRVVERSSAPKYSQQDYPYIQQGFIAAGYDSLLYALESFVWPNNETTNLYTQVAGLVVFAAAWVVSLVEYRNLSAPLDASGARHAAVDPVAQAEAAGLFVLVCCLTSDIVVCCFSTACHLWQARSHRYHAVLSVMDWGGTIIVGLTTCACVDFLPPASLHDDVAGAPADPWIVARNLAFDSLLGIEGTAVEESHVYHFGSAALGASPTHFFVVLACLLGCLVLFAVGTTSHMQRFGYIFTVAWYVGMPLIPAYLTAGANLRLASGIVAFAVGGFFFGSHIPEVFISRKFDLWLSSHTLWHCGYLLGLYQLHSCLALAYLHRVPWEPAWVTQAFTWV